MQRQAPGIDNRHVHLEGSAQGDHFFAVLPPFLPSSACAAEEVRGFFFPSFAALAFAFLAVSLPLPVFLGHPDPFRQTALRPSSSERH